MLDKVAILHEKEIENGTHWKYFLFQIQLYLKHWTKPATLSLISSLISDLTRSHSDLIVENALLRQQLIVLHRQVNQSLLTQHDRFLLVVLARFTRFWKQNLHIVQPGTLLRWHRDLFRFYWRAGHLSHPFGFLNAKGTKVVTIMG